jgi:hypothetical protein
MALAQSLEGALAVPFPSRFVGPARLIPLTFPSVTAPDERVIVIGPHIERRDPYHCFRLRHAYGPEGRRHNGQLCSRPNGLRPGYYAPDGSERLVVLGR